MSEFEQDPSASTGRFRAFVERGDQDTPRARRSRVSPLMMIAGVVVMIVVIVAIIIAVV
ncbi:MAG TPA: hypothetical protein VGL33_32440 [Streptosporangiaceae bacterium]|jgi:hypothetical protein